MTLLIFSGCASPQGDFQTKRDPSYNKTLGRILIVSLNEDLAARLGRDFSNNLLSQLTQLLSAKGVSVEVVHQNKDDLDPTAQVKSAAERFRPEALLYVAVSRVITHNNMQSATLAGLPQFSAGVSIAITFNMVDMQTGKVIWRGTDQFNSVPSPEDVADQLVKQLEVEKIL